MGTAAPLLEWGATADVVKKGRYVEISGLARDADREHPQRLILPPALALAPLVQREFVKQLPGIK
jgi:hypothetical protein